MEHLERVTGTISEIERKQGHAYLRLSTDPRRIDTGFCRVSPPDLELGGEVSVLIDSRPNYLSMNNAWEIRTSKGTICSYESAVHEWEVLVVLVLGGLAAAVLFCMGCARAARTTG